MRQRDLKKIIVGQQLFEKAEDPYRSRLLYVIDVLTNSCSTFLNGFKSTVNRGVINFEIQPL